MRSKSILWWLLVNCNFGHPSWSVLTVVPLVTHIYSPVGSQSAPRTLWHALNLLTGWYGQGRQCTMLPGDPWHLPAAVPQTRSRRSVGAREANGVLLCRSRKVAGDAESALKWKLRSCLSHCFAKRNAALHRCVLGSHKLFALMFGFGSKCRCKILNR